MTLRLAGTPCRRCQGGQVVKSHPAADATCLQCGDVPPTVNRPSDLWEYLEDREAEELMASPGPVYRGATHGGQRL